MRFDLGHLDLVGRPDDDPPVPPSMAVWRSVRATGDTKTRLSRRTLALPARCVDVLTNHRLVPDRMRELAGDRWIEIDLVFTDSVRHPARLERTSAVTSAPRSAGRPGSTPRSGRRASCVTPSSRCSPIAGCRSRRSHGSSGTSRRSSPSWCTASSSGPCSRPARRRWTGSSHRMALNLALREPGKGLSPIPLTRNRPLTCGDVVGDTGIEPVTSSVSRKRSPTELIAR